MPILTQLNLNIGTEQNPNMVLHDLHDIRISSTDVTTVTRLLGCDAGVNSIAPLTLANAASLLGAPLPKGILTVSANTIFENSAYCLYGNENLDVPTDYGVLITLRTTNSYTGYWGLQFIFNVGVATALYYRTGSATKQEWGSWKSIIMP